MCQSKANGGERCPYWHEERVITRSRALDKVNTKILTQLALIKKLESFTKEEIKELKKKQFFSKVKRDQDRCENKIRRTDQNLRNQKETLKDLKVKSGDLAEKLEEAYNNVDFIKKVDIEYKDNILGEATLVGVFSSDSQEWHDQRGRGYGGSDVAAVMNIKGAKTSHNDLFKLKTGEIVSKPGSSGAAKIGHQYEPIVLRKFADNNPDKKVMTSKGSWVNKNRSYQLANVDGLICENGSTKPNAILEIKTSSRPQDWVDKETGKPKVPEYYRTQLLWYMSTFGIKKGYLAAIINHNEYMEFEVVAKPGEIANMHKKVQQFRNKVNAYNKVAT